MNLKPIWFFALLFFANSLLAQVSKDELFNTIEKTAGVYFAYPQNEIKPKTPIPIGYKPFYISHLGRHGSRYLISDDEYKGIIDLFEIAYKKNVLTVLGKDILSRLLLLWKEVEKNGGNLSPVGIREQKGIADRMYKSYPEVFVDRSNITACATTVSRCVMSMNYFTEQLKVNNSNLSIALYSGEKWQQFLNHHTEKAISYRSATNTWKPDYKEFEKKHVNSDRIIKTIFTNYDLLETNISANAIMWSLYNIAGGMQNVETKISFYDLFTKDELFDLWQCKNYKTYVNDANCALNGGIMMENAKPLLRNIIDSAQKVIDKKIVGADFRFAHDGNIIPLAMLLHLDGCYNSISDPENFYKVWSDFKVAPMSGNIQMILFRSEKNNDILVKFLYNENEILVPPVKSDLLPYYHWNDVLQYYRSLL